MDYKLKIYSDGATEGRNGKLGTVSVVGLGVWIPAMDYGEGMRINGVSNNEAEFKALIWAMEIAIEKGIKHAEFNLDSQIVVNRANGRRPKKKHANARMDDFQDKVVELKKEFTSVSFVWIPREQNTEADYYSTSKLCTN